MSKPHKYGTYECPYDKGIYDVDKSKYFVGGRYCKNNCEKYRDGSCKKWN